MNTDIPNMSIANKTLHKTLAWRIGAAVIVAICTGNSVTAQVEFADQESFSILQQSSDGVTPCDFHQCWLGKAPNRLPCQGKGRRIGGVVAGVKQSAAMLSHRETPLGDMGLHFPYQATQMYYYRRPYNSHHVPRQLNQSQGSTALSAFGKDLGYSNQIFEEAHQSVEGYLNSEGIKLEEDGLLEYADWKQHQLGRLTWETPPRYHAEAQDPSFPVENEEPEEALIEKAGNRVSFVRRDRAPDDEQVMPNPLNPNKGFSALRAGPTQPAAKSP